jgi:DNA relaxase NicK
MIERNVDYFAASINFPEIACRENEYKLVPSIKFYKRGYEDEKQIRYYYGNPNSKKAFAVVSGQAMQNLRMEGNTDAQIIDAFLSKGARCSRIDLAVTEWVEDNLVTLDEVETWYKQGKITSTWVAGGCKEIAEIPQDGDRAVQTIYIGSIEQRGKKGIFRAYDKGIEINLEACMVTRLEIEDRGDKAMVSAHRVAQTNDVAGVFRTRFNVDDEQFERLMQNPVADLTRRVSLPKRDEIDVHVARWQWLIKQIAPSIKQAIADDKRLELTDGNLIRFLTASGLMNIVRENANSLADKKYRDKMLDNGLEPD